MSSTDRLAHLMMRGPLLLDFDGPICSIFAGYPATHVAADLIGSLRRTCLDLPNRIEGEEDPLEILRWVGTLGDQKLVSEVEDALCTAELKAATTAQPTPHGRKVIVAAHQIGLPVAIVSNNSAGAVLAYLSIHRLDRYVYPVIGRAYTSPAQMKPNPTPILAAAHALGAEPSTCVLVGDSLSDIEGGKAAGTRTVGYANKDGKLEKFRSAGADEVIMSMAEVAHILADLPST